MFKKNKLFNSPIKPNRFRRLAIGSWGSQSDPTIYGVVEVNAEKALAYISKEKERTGKRITITHFAGKVFAKILERQPDMNVELRWGQFFPRKNIDVSFQVAIEHQKDLSAGIVRNANQASLGEIADVLNHDAHQIRGKNDPGFRGVKNLSSIIPGVFQRFAVGILQFVISTLNLWHPILGVPRDAFGGVMITNVGSLGLDFALPALFPPAGVPMIIAVGAIYDAPVFEKNDDGTVKVRLEKHMKLCGAFDHRYLDGLHGSKIANDIRFFYANPDQLEVDFSKN